MEKENHREETEDQLDNLTERLGNLDLAESSKSSNEEQKNILLALMCIEDKPEYKDARNEFIHKTEDKEHNYPSFIFDLMESRTDAFGAAVNKILKSPSVYNEYIQHLEGMFLIRFLDICREHYYNEDKEGPAIIDKLPVVKTIIEKLKSQFPEHNLDKKKNQLRNYVAYELGQKRFIKTINDCKTLDEALNKCKQGKIGGFTIEAAQQRMKGLDNLGQLLHIIKSSYLKKRDHRPRAEIEGYLTTFFTAAPELFTLLEKILECRGFIIGQVWESDRLKRKEFKSIHDIHDIGHIYNEMMEQCKKKLLGQKEEIKKVEEETKKAGKEDSEAV